MAGPYHSATMALIPTTQPVMIRLIFHHQFELLQLLLIFLLWLLPYYNDHYHEFFTVPSAIYYRFCSCALLQGVPVHNTVVCCASVSWHIADFQHTFLCFHVRQTYYTDTCDFLGVGGGKGGDRGLIQLLLFSSLPPSPLLLLLPYYNPYFCDYFVSSHSFKGKCMHRNSCAKCLEVCWAVHTHVSRSTVLLLSASWKRALRQSRLFHVHMRETLKITQIFTYVMLLMLIKQTKKSKQPPPPPPKNKKPWGRETNKKTQNNHHQKPQPKGENDLCVLKSCPLFTQLFFQCSLHTESLLPCLTDLLISLHHSLK